jgi:hypothetical protein
MKIIWLLVILVLGWSFKLDCDDIIRADLNKGFQYQIKASGGTGKYRYEVNGLPSGLKLQGAVIAGKPDKAGLSRVLLNGYDEKGTFSSKTINFVIGDSGSQSFSSSMSSMSGSSQ